MKNPTTEGCSEVLRARKEDAPQTVSVPASSVAMLESATRRFSVAMTKVSYTVKDL